MNHKHATLLATSALWLVALLTGCGAGGAADGGPSRSTASPSVTEAAPAFPTAAFARMGDEPVTDGRRDLRVDDQFAIGSVTKSVVAAQVLQMVEAGQLELDDPVVDHLPADLDFDTNGATVRPLAESPQRHPGLRPVHVREIGCSSATALDAGRAAGPGP